MKSAKTSLCLMVLLVCGGSFSMAWADFAEDFFGAKPGDYIKSRTYVGGFGTSANINNAGGFDGTFGFVAPVNGNEVDLIPGISRNFGFGALVGHREGPYAFEVNYWRSDHNSFWTGGGAVTFYGTSSYQSLNVDVKRYLFTQLPTQPFFSLGLGFPWLTTPGASSINAVDVADSTVAGMGFNLGLGMEIYMGPDYSIVGGAVQRWSGFNQINGISGQSGNKLYTDGVSKDVTNLEGDGLNFYVGATIGFE